MSTNTTQEINEEQEIDINNNQPVPDGGGFRDLQVDLCKEKESLVPKDVCPDERCNENAPVIDPWGESIEQTYFDPRTCEYVVIVVRDKKDLGFDPGNPEAVPYSATRKPQAAGFWKEQFTEQRIVTIEEERKDYASIQDYCEDNIKDAIKIGLAAYNKRVSDATVCALGGCATSFEELERNREIILKYQSIMQAYDDSISDRITAATWATTFAAAGIAAFVVGPIGFAVAAGISLGVSLIGETVENLVQSSDLESNQDFKIFQDQIKSILGIHDYDQIKRLESIYGKINPYALEWVAYVPKENGWTIDDSGALKFQVRIPAYNFNAIPADDPEEDEEEEDEVGDAEIILTNSDWRSEYTSLYTGLVLYRYEQDMRLLVDNATINFRDDPTGHKLFFFNDLKKELKFFKEELESFLINNDMCWGYQKFNPVNAFKDEIDEMVITLGDKGEGEDTQKLFIKKIEIKTPHCPLAELKDKGKPGERVVIASGVENFKTKVYNPTLLNLLAKKDTAILAMQAEEPNNINDFCDNFIYPPVYSNYGMDTIKQEESNTSLGCIADKFAEIVDWKELISDLVVGTVDALKDEITKEMCVDKTKTKDPALKRQKDPKTLERIRQHMTKNKIKELKKERRKEYLKKLKERNKKLDRDAQLSRKDIAKQVEDQLKQEASAIQEEAKKAVLNSAEYEKLKKNNHPYMGDIKDVALKQFDYEDSLLKLFADIFKRDDGENTEEEKFRLFTHQIGWCGMVVALRKVLNCLFGQISFEDAIKIIFKKATGALSLNQFYYLFVGLPIETQFKITEYVKQQLSAAGNIGAGVDLQNYVKPENVAARDASQREQARQRVGAIQGSFNTKKYNRLKSIKSTEKNANGTFKNKTDKQIKKDSEKADKMMAKFVKQVENAEKLRPNQGSIGKATANMLGVVLEAYIRAFEEVLSLEDILNWLKKIPGVGFTTWLFRNFFSCPSKPLINPPLKDLIKFPKFKIDFCDPTKGFFNFKIPTFNIANPWEIIKKVFFAILKRIVREILIKLLLRLLQLLEELLCKLLEGIGKGALNAVTGNNDGQPFLEAFRGVFCGPDATDDDVRKTIEGAMAATGNIPPGKEAQAASEIPRALMGNFSTKEMMQVIADPANNPEIIDRVQRAIVRYSPTFSEMFSNPNVTQNLFNSLNNMLPNDEQQALLDALAQDFPDDIPLLDTICLNKDEIDEWNRLRKQALTDQGLNDADAETLIENYNNRTNNTVEEFVDILAKGPDTMINEAVSQILNDTGMPKRDDWGDFDKPPSCKVSGENANPLLRTPPSEIKLDNLMMDDLFRTIDSKYAEDLFASKDGVLGRVLSDTNGISYWWHNIWTKFIFSRSWYYNSEEEAEADESLKIFGDLIPDQGFFPDTVGMYLKNQIAGSGDSGPSFKTAYGTLNGLRITSEYEFGFFERQSIRYAFQATPVRQEPEYQMEFVIPYPMVDDEDVAERFGNNINKNYVSLSMEGFDRETTPDGNFSYEVMIAAQTMPFINGADHMLGLTEGLLIKNNMVMDDEIESLMFNFNFDKNKKDKYRLQALEHFIKLKTGNLNSSPVSDFSDRMFDNIADKIFNITRELLVLNDDAFKFGFVSDDFVEDNFTYVNPDGDPDGQDDYTHDEEEQILGVMKKPHERIHILDPKRHGGRYKRPPMYIEEAKMRGWMGIAQAFIPEIDGCPDKGREHVGRISEVIKHVNESKSRIKLDDRLFKAKDDCFLEVPFDRILSKENHAAIEGLIKVAIRTVLTDEIISYFPIFGNLEFNDRNFDSTVAKLLVKRVGDDIKTTNAFGPRKIENRNYWLAMLEQGVQMYQRMYENGMVEVDDSSEVGRALEKIRNMQEAFDFPSRKNVVGVYHMWANPKSKEGVQTDGGTFGGRTNRRIAYPSRFYDMDKREIIQEVIEQEITEMSGPFEIPYDEYVDMLYDGKAYKTEAEAKHLGGAYISNPSPSELEELGISWENPPEDLSFAKYELRVVGTETVPSGSPTHDPFDFTKHYAHYCALAYQVLGDAMFYVDQSKAVFKFLDTPRGPSAKNWQLASKLYAVRSVLPEAEIIFAELVKMEINEMAKFLNDKYKPNIVDLSYYLLTNDELFEKNQFKNLGTADHEQRVANGEPISIGDAINVVSDVLEGNPWEGTNDSDISFKIEKYIRLVDKEAPMVTATVSPTGNTSPTNAQREYEERIPEIIRNRSYKLKDVVNIEEFQDFVERNKEILGSYYLSDLFGDAEHEYFIPFQSVFQILKSNTALIDEYKILLEDNHREALQRGTIDKKINDPITGVTISQKINYNPISLTKKFLDAYNINYSNKRPQSYRGMIGVNYGLRIVMKINSDFLNRQQMLDISDKDIRLSKKEKSFYYRSNPDCFSIPIASAEVELLDHKFENFNYLTGDYKLDLDCLLRKIAESPEYRLFFKYIFPVNAVNSMVANISNISFKDSIGVEDNWAEPPEDGPTFGRSDEGDLNSWDRRSFKSTKLTVRNMFSGFYLSDDFEEPEGSESFQWGQMFAAWRDQFFGGAKRFLGFLPWWWRANINPRPYDAEGNECTNEYEKLT